MRKLDNPKKHLISALCYFIFAIIVAVIIANLMR